MRGAPWAPTDPFRSVKWDRQCAAAVDVTFVTDWYDTQVTVGMCEKITSPQTVVQNDAALTVASLNEAACPNFGDAGLKACDMGQLASGLDFPETENPENSAKTKSVNDIKSAPRRLASGCGARRGRGGGGRYTPHAPPSRCTRGYIWGVVFPVTVYPACMCAPQHRRVSAMSPVYRCHLTRSLYNPTPGWRPPSPTWRRIPR